MGRSSREMPEPGGVVVAGGPAGGDSGLESPRAWVLVVVALLFGLALGLLFGSSFDVPPVEETQPPAASLTTVPGAASVSLVEEFAAALGAGDRKRIVAVLDEEPVVLALPGWAGSLNPVDWSLTSSEFDPSVMGETAALAAALGYRLTLTDCHAKPLIGRGAELYDEMVACSFAASDRLSERHGWQPETGQMDLGVRNGRIRATFTFSSSTAEPRIPFWEWLRWFRPHLNVHWLSAWEMAPQDGGEFAEMLLVAASDYAAWVDEQGTMERGAAEPPAPRPEGGTGPTYRTGHVMVYDPATDRVLLLGGATAPESSDFWWGPVPDSRIWGFDYAARTWMVWQEHRLIHEAASYDLESGLLVVISGTRDGGNAPWLTSDGELEEEWQVLTYAASTGAWDEKKSIPTELLSGWRYGLFDPPRAVYDAGSDRVVVADSGGGLWSYDVDTDAWVELQPPSPSPCELFGQPMAYDAGTDRIVLSGQGELCVYDLDTNTLIARPRGGAPDEVSAAAYDQQSGLVVMLGDGSVWAYHTPSGLLEQVGPIADGVLWSNAAMVYQPTADRMVVFDGARTWAYHLDSDQWRQLEP